VTDRLLTARDVADRLGMSPDWVLDKFEARKLRGIKIGGTKNGRVRFRAEDIDAAIEDWTRGPALVNAVDQLHAVEGGEADVGT
jgi:predicted DNA-binding transcriptional regulator AlpA